MLKWFRCRECGLEVCGYLRGAEIRPKMPQTVPPERTDFESMTCRTCAKRTHRAETLENLRVLGAQRDELMEKLERSLALADFVPDAFAHGKVRSWVYGSPSSGFRFVVEMGDGERREWPVAEVPRKLLPKRLPGHADRYYQRELR